MVDVGYFIDGERGELNGVLMGEPQKDYIIFRSYDEKCEYYMLKYEHIEYILPHKEKTMVVGDKDGWHKTPYTEEEVIKLCQKVDPPMTNFDKFKEVFGFEPKDDSLCDLFGESNCNKYPACKGCPLDGHCDWDDDYKKVEVEDL